MPKRKKIIFAIWIAVALSAIALYLIFPEWFTADKIKQLLERSHNHILLVYLLVSLLRGVFFIPSTPFVIAGAMLFPQIPFTVFLISLAGVWAGGSYIFFFTEYLEVEKLFMAKHAHRFEKLKAGMHRHGLWIVMLWSFFPVVPTDLISYTAGVTRMPFWKYSLGLLIGEAVLVGIYVFSGKALGEWMMG